MHPALEVYLLSAAAIVIGAVALHVVARAGAVGRRLEAVLCRAPGADVVVLYFTVLPQVAGAILLGWLGIAVATAGAITGGFVWIIGHEILNPSSRTGPRIYRTQDRQFSPWRNHFAVWWTALAVPVFWLIRLAEVVVYPPLTWTIRLPKYRQGDWINVSRHKFDGLVGYDRIWCLYCDWMTGVWSLGSEMLRNVESFWCPIRFSDRAKCENCRVDFPDLDLGWVPSDARMSDVIAVLEEKYGGGVSAWFGHPVRLTIDQEPIERAGERPDG